VVECQLPKLNVAGSNPVSRSIKISNLGGKSNFFHTGSLHFTPLSSRNSAFKPFRRFGTPGQGGPGAYVQRYSDSVTPPVGGDFGIDFGIMAEAGMSAAQHVKIRPSQSDSLKPVLHVAMSNVVPPHGLLWIF
jgi:hypothetical protein